MKFHLFFHLFLQDIKNRFVWQINLTIFRFLTSRRIDTRVMVLQTFALPLGHGVFCTMWCIFKPFLSIFTLFPSKRNQLETSLCSYYNRPLSFCEPLFKEIRGLFANDNYKRIKNDLYLGLNLPPLKGLGLKTLLDTFLFRDEEANDSQMIVLSIPPFFMISL